MTFSAVGGRRQTFSALSQRPPRMSLISVDGYFGALTIRSLPSMPIPGISISDTSSPLGVPTAPGGRVAHDIVSHPPHATQPTTTLLTACVSYRKRAKARDLLGRTALPLSCLVLPRARSRGVRCPRHLPRL